MEVKTDLRDGQCADGKDEDQCRVRGDFEPVIPSHVSADGDDAHEEEEGGGVVFGSTSENKPAEPEDDRLHREPSNGD